MENMAGVRQLIDRQPIPPRMKMLIKQIEDRPGFAVDAPPATGAAEVKEIMQLVDGNNLLAGIVACILASIPVEEPEADPEPEPENEDGDDETDDQLDNADGSEGGGEDPTDQRDIYTADENDTVKHERGDFKLIEKGGGHYAVIEGDRIDAKARGQKPPRTFGPNTPDRLRQSRRS